MMRLMISLACLLAVNAQAVESASVCEEAWTWVNKEYYQPVRESEFLKACPDSLEKVLNKHSSLVKQESDSEGRDYFGAIGLEFKLDGDKAKILQVFEGFPAAKAGLKSDDQILAIDGLAIQGLKPGDLAKRLRGQVGSTVTLTVLRSGEILTTAPISRRLISLPSVTTEEIRPGFLWVRVTSFDSTTVRAVIDALMTRRRVKEQPALEGLVVDFRGNTGGLLNAALELAAAFLPEKAPLIQMHEKGGKHKTILANDSESRSRGQISRLPPEIKSLPLMVLMNRGSAAGSEIVAGVWQGYGKARIIGMPSFGKDTIETLHLLEKHPTYYLKLTTASWSYFDGRQVAGQGLKPDFQLDDGSEVIKSTDPAVALALHVLDSRREFVDTQLDKSLQRVKKLRDQFEHQAAIEELNRILAIVPDSLQARYLRAATLAELGQREGARQDRTLFNLLATGESKQKIAPLNCWAGLLTGDYDMAASACQKAISAKPAEAAPWINLGHLALMQGDESTMWHHYRIAMPMLDSYWPISLEDVRVDFKLLAQGAHLPKGLTAQRIQGIQAKFEKEYRSLSAAMRDMELLTIQYMQGNVDKTLSFDEKQALLEKILAEEERLLPKQHPRILETLTRLGIAHLKQDRFKQALPYFQRALDGFKAMPQPQEKLPFLERAVKACALSIEK